MLGTSEDGSSADLEGGAAGGDNQLDVVVAVVYDLGDAVMQEADADFALAGAHILGGAGAGLGVNLNVFVQVDQVLDAFVVALLLDHGVDNQLGSAGGVVVGQPDEALILGLEQVVPVLRRFQVQTLQGVLVHHKAQNALVDAVPVAVLVLVLVAYEVGGVLGLIGLQQPLGGGHIVGVGSAAKPDVGGGVAALFLNLGLDLASGQALEGGLDAVKLLELLAGSGQVLFLAGAVDHQLALGLGGVNQVGHGVGGGSAGSGGIACRRGITGSGGIACRASASAAGGQGQDHCRGQQRR